MDRLLDVLSIQSVSNDQFRMFAYIVRQLQDIPNVRYYLDEGNLYIQRGRADTYPCMVAHMDTVHDIVEDLHPLVFNGMVTGFNRVAMEQTGIGGDDKVGIYIALECLREFDNMKVAFFRDEEVGCIGSYLSDVGFFKDCRFVLQCDRRGNSDFIVDASGVALSSTHFQDDVFPLIKSYGYGFAKGMMTDVMALKESGIGCSMANISCGYYNPHTAQEYVDIFDVENCLEMCKTIITYCTETYKHKYKPRYAAPKAAYGKYSNGAAFWDWNAPSSSTTHVEAYCKDCWGAEAVKDGLCDMCLSWYAKDNTPIF